MIIEGLPRVLSWSILQKLGEVRVKIGTFEYFYLLDAYLLLFAVG